MPLLQMDASTHLDLTWRVEASRARVWDCITTADHLRLWLGEVVDGAVGNGSDFVVDHGGNYCCWSTVVTYGAKQARLHLALS